MFAYDFRFSAYLLGAAALSPFYGKVTDMVGRKIVLYPIILLLLVRTAV